MTNSFSEDPTSLGQSLLGGLPSLRRQETWKDLGIRSAVGVVEQRVEHGLQPQSRTHITFTGPFEYNQATGSWGLTALYGLLDAAPVNQAAKLYLNTANVVRVSLFPQQ